MFTNSKNQFVFKVFLIGLIVLCASTVKTLTAEAHTLQIDGTIGAIFHTDPDDNPIAGKPTAFYFEFKDTAGKLNLKLCDCTFSIISNGSPIYSGKLGTDSAIQYTTSNVSFYFTFPSTGNYTVVALGNPAATGNFQSFKLSYNIEVKRVALPVAGPSSSLTKFLGGHTIHLILFGGAILIAIFIVIRDKRRQDKTKIIS